MRKTLIVNLFAGAGAGKSTMSANIFSELKWMGIETELALEYAKDLVWEESYKTLKDQIHVLGEQVHRIERLIGKVDVVITDSPILLSVIYKPEKLSSTFDNLVVETFNTYNNLNYYIERVKPYNPNGRMQTEDEAKQFDLSVRNLLDKNKINYSIVKGNKPTVSLIVEDILKQLGYLQNVR